MLRKLTFLLFCFYGVAGNFIFSQQDDRNSFTIVSRYSFYSVEQSAELLLNVPKRYVNNVIKIKLLSKGEIISDWSGIPGKQILRLPFLLNRSIPGKIDAEIVVNSNGNEKFFASGTLIVLPHKANEVKTDRLTGGLIVNGRQLFPFGFYCVLCRA